VQPHPVSKVTDVSQKRNMYVIFFDFAKAFDKVHHRGLLPNLQSRGIDGKVVRWVGSWLKGRKQRVCIDSTSVVTDSEFASESANFSSVLRVQVLGFLAAENDGFET